MIAADRNIISGNYLRGIDIEGSPADLIEGNYIGTDISGAVALGNGLLPGYAGIYDTSSGDTIGGTVAGAGNIIDGNGTEGIRLDTASATGNLVAGNFIGVNAAGAALPNHLYGILISVGSGNTIGGTTALAANVISGNQHDGVHIYGNDNLVEGNDIGTNALGTTALANGANGVTIQAGGEGNTVGGLTSSAANVISGNTGYGIQVDGATTTGNVVANNWVGTGTSGSGSVPNGSGSLS